MARLTIKQQSFVSEFVRNGGNATAAALAVYNVNPNSARSVGSENLTKPNIRFAIEKALGQSRLSINDALLVLKEGLEAETIRGRPDWNTRLKAADMLFKLADLYPRNNQNRDGGRIYVDRKKVAELEKEPVEVLEWAYENGRMPNTDERKLILGSSHS